MARYYDPSLLQAALTQIKCYREEKLLGGEVRSLTQDNGYRARKAKIDEFSE